MSYAWLGATTLLAAFGLTSLLAAGLVITFAPWLRDHALAAIPRARARWYGALRLVPTLAAGLLACAVVIPAWLLFEPRGVAEIPGRSLLALAWVGASLLIAGLARGSCAVLAPFPAPVRILEGSTGFCGVAVVGVRRPRLFVSERVREALTPEEFAAVLAHERGHIEARDNLWGLVFRFAADPLCVSGLGRDLERAFWRAAEATADAHAGREPALRLALASALVKVARLVPAGNAPRLPVAALHSHDALAARVHALLSTPRTPIPFSRSCADGGRLGLEIVALVLSLPPFWGLAQAAIEALVHLP
jgi:Zn-dependent protease with chaperone function